MQFCHKHLAWRFSEWVILVFYFFDLADHIGSPRCYQPNGWVIGVLGFLVVVLVDMFFFRVFCVLASGSARLLWVVVVFLRGVIVDGQSEHR